MRNVFTINPDGASIIGERYVAGGVMSPCL